MNTETILQVLDKPFQPYIPFSEIIRRIGELGSEINRDYEGKNPLFVPVLNGSFIFASDLIREICIPCEVSFIKAASYEGMKSGGKVNQLIGLDRDVRGRQIILVEDIVDTGKTVAEILQQLQPMEPAGIQVASLFVKPEAFCENFEVRYRGFDIPDKFIIGYGLDYNGYGRNYRDVYSLYDQ